MSTTKLLFRPKFKNTSYLSLKIFINNVKYICYNLYNEILIFNKLLAPTSTHNICIIYIIYYLFYISNLLFMYYVLCIKLSNKELIK